MGHLAALQGRGYCRVAMHSESRLGCCARAAAGGRRSFTPPGTSRKYERSLPFAFKHLALDLEVSLEKKTVTGSATLNFERAGDSTILCLDAIAFDIASVKVDIGKGFGDASYEYDGELIEVNIPKRARAGKVRVQYTAKPRVGLYFLSPDDQVKDRPVQVWSQCQDEDARHWFPCHDKPHVKTTAEFTVTVPARFSVLCNGELIAEEGPSRSSARSNLRSKARAKSASKSRRGAGRSKADSGAAGPKKTFRYAIDQPLPSYLVTLVVGEFDRVEDRDAVLTSGRKVPVVYWVPKGMKKDAMRSFGETPNMIEHFSQLIGVDYPYSRYTQVVVSDFIFGGMENTSATTMYEHIMLDERAALDIESNYLIAHELAHQWFGDWVTCKDWPHAWLNEGFATYFEHLEKERRMGQDEYLLGLETDLRAYLSEAGGEYQRPVVCKDYAEPIDLFDRHLYEKGSLILHMLRGELGDKTFFSAIESYLKAHAGGNVTTDQLRSSLEAAAGRSLDRFFDEWLERAGHPNVRVSAKYSDKQLLVHFEQTHKGAPRELRFEAEVMDASGKVHQLSALSGEKHTVLSLSLPKRPQYVGIDPKLRLVGQVDVDLAGNWLKAQLNRPSSGYLRRQAALLLGKSSDFTRIQLLGETLRNESETWYVQAACAESLAQAATDDALDELLQSTTVKHPKARAAVAQAIGKYEQAKTQKPLIAMLENERSYLAEAAITRALGKLRDPKQQRRLKSQLRKKSWADVIGCAALDSLAELETDDRSQLLIEYTAYGKPTRIRRRSVLALGRVGDGKGVRQHLERLLDDSHPHFREDVIRALLTHGDARARGALRRRLSQEKDGRVIGALGDALRRFDSKDSQSELTDRIGKLERELNELRGKLSQLSAPSNQSRRKPNRS